MKVIVRDHVYRIVDLGPTFTEDDDLDAAFAAMVGTEYDGPDRFWPDLPGGWAFDFDADTTVEPYEGDAAEAVERLHNLYGTPGDTERGGEA